MSLQTSIHKLNSELISLFARVDAWCDREAQFLDMTERCGYSPRETISRFLLVNDRVLTWLKNAIGNQEGGGLWNSHSIDALLVWDERFDRESSHLHNASVDTLRALMREQLFHLLCAIDSLHNNRLDVRFNVQDPSNADGIDVIRALIKKANTIVHQQDGIFSLQ